MKNIILTFIPIFVAMDPIGILPIYLTLTHELSKKEKHKVILQSLITAILVALSFILLGDTLFRFLGITLNDFLIAGGILLLVLAISDILSLEPVKGRISKKTIGAVPLGTPLIVGPAVLTTSLVQLGTHGLFTTLIAVILNIVIVGIILYTANFFLKLLGETGTRAVSKIINIILASIAVMMIRSGITNIFNLYK